MNVEPSVIPYNHQHHHLMSSSTRTSTIPVQVDIVPGNESHEKQYLSSSAVHEEKTKTSAH